MTVVSQKRDFVFDFDSHVIAQRGEYVYLHIDGRDVEIGKYESHERAQEVLKEMIEKNVIEVAYYMPEVKKMDIIKAIISTLDFLMIALFLSFAITERENKAQTVEFTSLSLLIGSNILLMWS